MHANTPWPTVPASGTSWDMGSMYRYLKRSTEPLPGNAPILPTRRNWPEFDYAAEDEALSRTP
jgi:hypothetical protein